MKSLGDIARQNLGLEVENTDNSVRNEAVAKYWDELKQEKSAIEPFDADKVLNYLAHFSGKVLESQGKSFVIDDANRPYIYFLTLYFSRDERVKKWLSSDNHRLINDFSFEKGLLLAGSYGLGKSLMLKAASNSHIPGNRFGFTTTNQTVQYYETEGPKFLNSFFKGNRCFDDFGTESKAWHYGKQVDIFKTILEERYNHFLDGDCKTHLSTNLTIDEIGKRYGDRVESRLYEMFNIVILTGKDRRKQ